MKTVRMLFAALVVFVGAIAVAFADIQQTDYAQPVEISKKDGDIIGD